MSALRCPIWFDRSWAFFSAADSATILCALHDVLRLPNNGIIPTEVTVDVEHHQVRGLAMGQSSDRFNVSFALQLFRDPEPDSALVLVEMQRRSGDCFLFADLFHHVLDTLTIRQLVVRRASDGRSELSTLLAARAQARPAPAFIFPVPVRAAAAVGAPASVETLPSDSI